MFPPHINIIRVLCSSESVKFSLEVAPPPHHSQSAWLLRKLGAFADPNSLSPSLQLESGCWDPWKYKMKRKLPQFFFKYLLMHCSKRVIPYAESNLENCISIWLAFSEWTAYSGPTFHDGPPGTSIRTKLNLKFPRTRWKNYKHIFAT